MLTDPPSTGWVTLMDLLQDKSTQPQNKYFSNLVLYCFNSLLQRLNRLKNDMSLVLLNNIVFYVPFQ